MSEPPIDLTCYDRPALQEELVRHDAEGAHVTVALEGLRCGGCVVKLEKALAATPGLVDLNINLGNHRAEVTWDPSVTPLSRLLIAFREHGHPALPFRRDAPDEARQAEFRSGLIRLGVAGLGMMQVMMFAIGLYAGAFQGMEETYRHLLRWVSLIVTTPVLLIAGRPFFGAALRDLRQRRLGMDVPVAIAMGSAYAASVVATVLGTGEVYFESVCMFIFFLSIGRFLEMRARHKAADAIGDVVRSAPATATRLTNGTPEVVAARELRPGDRVLVKPGETVPADGCVTEGRSSVNEAMLTGEHWPRPKAEGDAVIGGTINETGTLTVAVDTVGERSVLSSILRLVDSSSDERPMIAQLADRVASVFVPTVLIIAVSVALAWYAIDPERWFWITLSVLVITCPCALSLATPAALTAASGGLLARGLLATRSHVLETLAKVTHVVFDKTGTLTEGRIRIQSTRPLRDLPADRCLAIARALEQSSEHPIAAAFAPDRAEASTDELPLLRATDVTIVTNRGVEGSIDSRRYRIGSPLWIGTAPQTTATQKVFLADEDGPLCAFTLEDSVRPEAGTVIASLRALGIESLIASGDPSEAPQEVATQLGITTVLSAATPEEKLQKIRALQESGAVVAMVGDGVNDTPGLSGAHVSIAMGGGTALAMSRADSVLLKNDLGTLVEAIRLARKSRRVIAQNLVWAAGYNLVALPLAAAGLVAPYWAALGMSLSSLVVVSNALRLGAAQGNPTHPGSDDAPEGLPEVRLSNESQLA